MMLTLDPLTSPLPQGFVYLHDVDPSIRADLRYLGSNNFLGQPVNGYQKPVVILTQEAAEAVQRVQIRAQQDGYSLLVYDAYRPQRAVNHFFEWSQNKNDQKTKKYYYPRVDKKDAFALGYIAKKSGHTRGSTVDLTLIEWNQPVHAPVTTPRSLEDGFEVQFLDDGSVDMGTSLDLFDAASHSQTTLIQPVYQQRREYLRHLMEGEGFKPYPKEWWHFTLKSEPFPDIYFDFPVA